jgi:hypothetical protein
MYRPTCGSWETTTSPPLGTADRLPCRGCTPPLETRQADQMPPHQPESRTNAEIRSSCAAHASQISGRSRRFSAAETSPFLWTFGEAFR